MWRLKTAFSNVLIGLLLAGPIAAAALVLLPEHWQGPLVPWGAAVAAVLVVNLLRPRRRPES